MADPVTTTLVVASSALSGYAALKGGQAKSNAYEAEARARETEARLSDLQSHQIAADRRSELNANLAAIAANRAARGSMAGSSTALALSNAFTDESSRAMEAEVLEPMLRARSSRLAAGAARQGASAARTASYAQAFSSFSDAGLQLYRAMPKPKAAA